MERGHNELIDSHHFSLALLPSLRLNQVQSRRTCLKEVQQSVAFLRLCLEGQAHTHAIVPFARIFLLFHDWPRKTGLTGTGGLA